jgi:hypothetical protein
MNCTIFGDNCQYLLSGRKSLSNLTLFAAINPNFSSLTRVAEGMNIWVQIVLRQPWLMASSFQSSSFLD